MDEPPPAPAPAPKRPPKRPPRATLEQKIQILDHHHRLAHTQLQTVDRFRHDVAILTLTFNEWLKNEHEYRRRYLAPGSPFEKQARRKATYKYAQINRAMDRLVQLRLAQGAAVSEPVLRDHWQMYAHQFGVDNPKRLVGFSHGWLSQFKKRHGLGRPRPARAGSLASRNEQLLARPAAAAAAAPDGAPALPPAPPPAAMDPPGVFRPQQTLSFPQHVACLSPDAARSAPPDPERPHERALPVPADLAEDLERAMRLPLAARRAVAAADVERLLADVADRFFDAHQYDYPQTVQLYEAFKASFASERLIRLRSAPGRDPPPEAPLQALVLRRRPSSRHRQASQPPQHQPQHQNQPQQHQNQPQQHQNQQQHGFHAEERVPVPMDNLFVRLRARLRAYADDGLWQGSELRLASELRRLWEQNKLMLS